MAFCLAAAQVSWVVVTETETIWPFQKFPEACSRALFFTEGSMKQQHRKHTLSSPASPPDTQNEYLPLKKISGDFRHRAPSAHWRVGLGGGGEAADEEKHALILYIDGSQW